MKRYEGTKILSIEDFRRQKGIYPEELLQAAHKQKKLRGGWPNKLKIEDMLLMALEYWGGIPHLFSYCLGLWSFRVKYISNDKMGRKRSH